MNVQAIIGELEQGGVSLAVEGENLKLRSPASYRLPEELLAGLREQKAAALAYLKARQRENQCGSVATPTPCDTAALEIAAIPVGAVLLAPRYDGGKPLATVPKCWCCQAPYQLEWVQEWRGNKYAWLIPGCGCLDARSCYRCFVCREHCRCDPQAGEQSQ